MTTGYATCHTDGCPSDDQPIEVNLTAVDADGGEYPVGGFVCGSCDQPITDVTDLEHQGIGGPS